MASFLSPASPRQLPVLLRGEPASVLGWVEHWLGAGLGRTLELLRQRKAAAKDSIGQTSTAEAPSSVGHVT
jgi:hypothetical protein